MTMLEKLCVVYFPSFHFFSTIQVNESGTQPKNTKALIQRFLWYSNILMNIKKFTSLFLSLGAIFTNMLCFIMWLFFLRKILNTMTNRNCLYYCRPKYPNKHGDTQFCPLLDCFVKPLK